MTRWTAVVAALAVAYGVGAFTGSPGPSRIEPAAHDDGAVLDEASRRISAAADKPVDADKLRAGAISGMLKELGDPWARYYPAPDYRDFTGWLNGERKAVDAEPEAGDVTVRREKKMTLVRVAVFTRGVGAQVRAAVRDSDAIILDLRGNPGGLLDEAVETASAFLVSGPVVTYEKRGRPAEVIQVTSPGDPQIPVVVLVDAGTASAAEIVAGCLRDRDRAVIIGSRTFGKGTVQEPVKLSDGSAVELTVGRYLTPAGRNLEGVGIEPDVAVRSDQAEQRARDVLNV